ncbi:MAG: hypothetical protein DMG01_00830 [Acidobacteria bacterium]|nr:MAG: hypothetical protein DMG01_00830 [Acidobacteriota bacterium]
MLTVEAATTRRATATGGDASLSPIGLPQSNYGFDNVKVGDLSPTSLGISSRHPQPKRRFAK